MSKKRPGFGLPKELVFAALLALQAGLGVGCGGMTQDGRGAGGGTGGGVLDGGTGGDVIYDGGLDLIYDGDGWDLIYDGYGGTGGGGGSAPLCYECFPFPAHCSDGTVYYQFAFGSACPPAQCESPKFTCALGCIDEEIDVQYADQDQTTLLCEESSIRGPGFPCRADIDCVTPVGAPFESNLTNPEAGFGGAGPGAESLFCSEEGMCVPGPASPVDDAGEECGLVTSVDHPGPVVGFAETCASGACLAVSGGASTGACTTSCEGDGDCPFGYECVEALDDRYTTWGSVAFDLPPPHVLACAPVAPGD